MQKQQIDPSISAFRGERISGNASAMFSRTLGEDRKRWVNFRDFVELFFARFQHWLLAEFATLLLINMCQMQKGSYSAAAD